MALETIDEVDYLSQRFLGLRQSRRISLLCYCTSSSFLNHPYSLSQTVPLKLRLKATIIIDHVRHYVHLFSVFMVDCTVTVVRRSCGAQVYIIIGSITATFFMASYFYYYWSILTKQGDRILIRRACNEHYMCLDYYIVIFFSYSHWWCRCMPEGDA